MIFIVLISMSAYTQNEKKYEKLIRKYDVRMKLKGMDKSSVSNFWNRMAIANYDKNEFEQKIESKSAQESLRELARGIELNKEHSKKFRKCYFSDAMEIFLKDSLCGNNLNDKISCVQPIRGEELNAFCTPDGYIYITDALVDLLQNDMEVLGVLAHEMAHYQLQHAIVEMYKTNKKLRTNQTIAVVTSAAVAGAEFYNQTNSCLSDYERNRRWREVDEFAEGAQQSAYESALCYHYKYSKDQEIEADIIAYRFLDWIGVGGVYYINALERLRDSMHKYLRGYTDDTHYSVDFRIGLLNHLKLMDNKRVFSNN